MKKNAVAEIAERLSRDIRHHTDATPLAADRIVSVIEELIEAKIKEAGIGRKV